MARAFESKPGIREWAVLAIGLGFVAGGLLLLPSKPDVAIVTLAFFGSCAVLAGHTVLRKRADSRMDLRWAGLVGGVPLRPSRSFVLLLATWLTLLGVVLLIFGGSYPPAFRAISWLLAAIGAALLVAWALRWIPIGYLQFDPQGITIAGRKSACLVPWQRIAAVSPGEVSDNAALFVFLNGLDGVKTEPPSEHARTLRRFEFCESWYGAPIVIMTGPYRLPLPALIKALERYVSDPSARAELGQRYLPSSEQDVRRADEKC